ncbi:unnamed protein product, partial [marine sediment metagenome]
SNVQSIKEHLNADINYQNKLLRFIENHDEPRAAVAFGADASMATSILHFLCFQRYLKAKKFQLLNCTRPNFVLR